MKAAIFLTLFMLLATPALSQDYEFFTLGLKAGLNLTEIKGDLDDDLKDTLGRIAELDINMKQGGVGGILLNWRLMPWFSVQPEVIFSQKGHQYESKINVPVPYPYVMLISNAKITQTLVFEYIEIPILAKFHFLNSTQVTPVLYLGPAIGFVVDARIKTKSGSYDSNRNVRSELEDYDYSIIVGGEIQFKNGGGYFFVDSRYTYGLKNVDKTEFNDMHNSVISVMVGYAW